MRYRVIIIETVEYAYEVEADTIEAGEAKALDIRLNADQENDGFVAVTDRDVYAERRG